MFGSITRLSDQSIQLQIANNVRVEVSRAAIVGYQGQEPVVSDGSSPS
jgi:preprotein translocase subunit YajC